MFPLDRFRQELGVIEIVCDQHVIPAFLPAWVSQDASEMYPVPVP
jgi:hypothetical protein